MKGWQGMVAMALKHVNPCIRKAVDFLSLRQDNGEADGRRSHRLHVRNARAAHFEQATQIFRRAAAELPASFKKNYTIISHQSSAVIDQAKRKV